MTLVVCTVVALSIAHGAVAQTYPGCNVNNATYCEGTHEELIGWERYQQNGQIKLLPTQNVTDFIGTHGQCTLPGGYLLTPSDDTAQTMMNRIVIGKVLGERFRLA